MKRMYDLCESMSQDDCERSAEIVATSIDAMELEFKVLGEKLVKLTDSIVKVKDIVDRESKEMRDRANMLQYNRKMVKYDCTLECVISSLEETIKTRDLLLSRESETLRNLQREYDDAIQIQADLIKDIEAMRKMLVILESLTNSKNEQGPMPASA